MGDNINLFNRICDAAEKIEKKLPANLYFMVYPNRNVCICALCSDEGNFAEEIDGDSFSSVRAFKVWAKWLTNV